MKRSRLSEDSGVVLVFTALILLVLIGAAALAIDLGRLYVARQRAQNVADASALAGGLFLTGNTTGETASANAANRCAESNNESLTGSDGINNWPVKNPLTDELGVQVTFPTSVTKDDGTTVSLTEGQAIRVDAKVPVEYGFGAALGYTGREVSASAVVTMSEIETIDDPLFPMTVTSSQMWDPDGNPIIGPGDLQVLKVVSWRDNPIGPGNFGAISFPGDSGGGDYRDRVAGTHKDPVRITVPMYVDTLPGNKIGPTDQGMKERLKGDSYTFESWKATYDPATGYFAETSRLVLIPIIDPEAGLSGHKEVEVIGFAAFFIETWDGKQSQVTGHFMQALSVGDAIHWNPFGSFTSGTNTLVHTIKLVG
jgi:Flp pilus assembly protein TadG